MQFPVSGAPMVYALEFQVAACCGILVCEYHNCWVVLSASSEQRGYGLWVGRGVVVRVGGWVGRW